MQVELDVLTDYPNKIWIQIESKNGYWQSIDYENVPPYCRYCWHIGYEEDHFHVYHPELRANPLSTQLVPPKQWKPFQALKPLPNIFEQSSSATPVFPVPIPTVRQNSLDHPSSANLVSLIPTVLDSSFPKIQ